MRVAFAGTPEFAEMGLSRLHAAGFQIPLVLTQPDRPSGRGLKLNPSPVKAFAQAHGIAVAQPRSLRLDGKYPEDAAQARTALESAEVEVMVVAAYGLLLPQWVLELPRRGCLNIHASLLPRWRGAAPIHRAIEAGDARTGVTIMQMDEGLDTGNMLLAEPVDIGPAETTASLHDRLAVLGARLIVETLELAACGRLAGTPQPAEGVSYARKVEKSESPVDWTLPAAVIERRIRAFDPAPGVTSHLKGEVIKLWGARPAAGQGVPGTILDVAPEGLLVACGADSALLLTELQRAGGKRLPARQFIQGMAVHAGQVFGPSGS